MVFQTKKQVSSGGVIFREQGGRFEVILISRKNKKNNTVWCLPKGKVEKGESPEEAATREVREETGLEGELIKRIDTIHYFYSSQEEKTRFSKTVDFYLFRCKGGNIHAHDDEVEKVGWFNIDVAVAKLTYRSERETMEKAKQMLKSLGN